MSILLLAVVPALGPLKANLQPDKTPKEQYDAVLKDYQKAQTDYTKLLSDAKTDEELKQAYAKRPDPAVFARQVLAIAEKNPKDEAAFEALVWVMAKVQSNDPLANQAIALLTRDHATHPRIVDICRSLTRSTSVFPGVEKLIRAVLEKNQDKDVQGIACLCLAKDLKNQSEVATRQKDDKKAAELSAQAEQMYERVVKEYGKVKLDRSTLAELAGPELFELRFLAIGKTAPDIVAEDIDGKAFKLSDYRGKVILLDFWGNW